MNHSFNHYKLHNSISVVIVIIWLHFWGILFGTFFWQIFSRFHVVFFCSNTLLATSEEWLVRLMWNEKEVSFGYWVNFVTLTYELTHDLDLEFFKVRYWNNTISVIDGLIHVKWNGNKSVGYSANYVTAPMILALNLKVKVWNCLMGGPIHMEWKGWKLIIHDSGLCVTMLGWVDVVQNSEWGFFLIRCWLTKIYVMLTPLKYKCDIQQLKHLFMVLKNLTLTLPEYTKGSSCTSQSEVKFKILNYQRFLHGIF